MTDAELHEDLPPVAHVTIVYTGPIAPHWELRVRYGDQKMLDDFWARVNARLLLLPKHDPQFRRNKERVNRDAERERITCDWDLGEDDADTIITPVAETAPVAVEQVAPAAETEAVAEPEVEAMPDAEAVPDTPGAESPAAGPEGDDESAAGGEPSEQPAEI